MSGVGFLAETGTSSGAPFSHAFSTLRDSLVGSSSKARSWSARTTLDRLRARLLRHAPLCIGCFVGAVAWGWAGILRERQDALYLTPLLVVQAVSDHPHVPRVQ